MSATLRLHPAHPPLWRSDDELQFGPDAVVTLRATGAWQERLIAALESGVPAGSEATLARDHQVSERAVHALLQQLEPVLVHDPAPRAHTVGVVRTREVPGLSAVVAGLAAAGLAPTTDPADGCVPQVLLSAHCVDLPAARALLAADVPHIPVVLRGDRAEVGPVVLPGRSPCLVCVDGARRDADAAWSLVRAQLATRPAPQIADALAHEAGFVAARLLCEPSLASRSVVLRSDTCRRRWRTHSFTEACACRSP